MTEPSSFGKSCRNSIIFCSLIFTVAIVITIVLPVKETTPAVPVVKATSEVEEEVSADFGMVIEEAGFVRSKVTGLDEGLALYRQPASRSAVEWFYLHITGNRDTTMAILEEANRNDIPLSLAFALAYTESRYNINAVNRNKNASIDRGLFQLNNRSFPQIKESDFFKPAISAKYGMSHLRYCLNIAGNEVTALAMYNAGTSKVRSNNTPASTLTYVGKIMAYRDKIDRLFSEEVSSYYDATNEMSGISVAYIGGRRTDK